MRASRRLLGRRADGGRTWAGDLAHTAPPFEGLVLEAKIRRPEPRQGWIPRPRLISILEEARIQSLPLILVDAPVGYGKTMLLAEWCANETDRRIAWVSLDADDSDPARLLLHVLAAVQRAIPGFGESLLPALQVQGARAAAAVPRLMGELEAFEEPVTLVLDDYHMPRGHGVDEVMGTLVEGLPSSVQVAIATRADPALSLGRLRAAGRLLEIRAADLRFDADEADALLQATAVVGLEPSSLEDLVDRTEGWPAGIYLAALSLRGEDDPSAFVRRFAGTNRHVADYLGEEVLRRQPEDVRAFLARSSALGRFSGQLCDAALDGHGSARLLEEIEHSNLFLVPLDDRREWYRYHHLVGDLLQAELQRTEPDLVPEIHRRAAAWFESQRLHEEAIGHAIVAGDGAQASALVSRHWRKFLNVGRLHAVQRWLDDIGEDAVARDVAAAVTAAWVGGLSGEPERTRRWLDVAAQHPVTGPLPDGTASSEFGVCMVEGLFGGHGVGRSRTFLERAWTLEADPLSPWRPAVATGLGWMALMEGNHDAARPMLEEAVRLIPPGEPIFTIVAVSTLSLVDGESGRPDEALALANEAAGVVEHHGLGADPRSAFAFIAMGRALADRGELEAAREKLEGAVALRRQGRLNPFPMILAMLYLSPVRMALGDPAGAREILDEARVLLATIDDGGRLPDLLAHQERALHSRGRRLEFGQTLSEREMSVLRMLPTPLTQREIGRELYLSLNTVKSHARALYRKLGVSSRRQAVAKARELGLL